MRWITPVDRLLVALGVATIIAVPVAGMQLLDRVVARVDAIAITASDVQAAIGLGLVNATTGGEVTDVAIQQTIDRQLLLNEVARFPPPEPAASAIDDEAAAMKKRAGARLDSLVRATGLDEGRIRESARDSLRIRAYLNQRFGTTTPVADEEVELYYQAHPQEFTRDGRVVPLAEAEAAARERAAAERRSAIVAQWVRDLRNRSEITIPAKQP